MSTLARRTLSGGVLGTGILIKRVAAEIKAAGRRGRRRARVVEMSVTVDTSS